MKNLVQIGGVILGIITIICGVLLITEVAYDSWRLYATVEGGYSLRAIIEPSIGALALFIVAAFLISPMTLFQKVYIRTIALVICVLLFITGILGIAAGVFSCGMAIGWDPVAGAVAFFAFPAALLAFLSAFILKCKTSIARKSVTAELQTEAKKRNGISIAALVCGIIGLLILALQFGSMFGLIIWIGAALSIMSIVLGMVALAQIRGNPALGGKELALVGLGTGIMGLIGEIYFLASYWL